MMQAINEKIIQNAIDNFKFEGKPISCGDFGEGYINGTFCARFEKNGQIKRYILQRINTDIFKNPVGLMKNIRLVTDHLRAKIRGNEQVLNLVKTKDENDYFCDDFGNFFRAYDFIENAKAYQTVLNEQQFFCVGKTFGDFSNKLADFDATQLFDVIPNFHNTKIRYDDFLSAVKNDSKNRADSVKKEIDFINKYSNEVGIIQGLIDDKKIPLRVTHNDTKLNNVMMDSAGNGICVLDLDTIMAGTILFDFGDAIRFGANKSAEDCLELQKVSLDLQLFCAYSKGFIGETKSTLTKIERENLAFGAKIITLEQAIRFLGDYINGDVYYKTLYENQNLARARTQLKLVFDMEEKFEKMQKIINEI